MMFSYSFIFINWMSLMVMEIHQKFSPRTQRSHSPVKGHTVFFIWHFVSRVFSCHGFGWLFPSYQKLISLFLCLIGVTVYSCSYCYSQLWLFFHFLTHSVSCNLLLYSHLLPSSSKGALLFKDLYVFLKLPCRVMVLLWVAAAVSEHLYFPHYLLLFN